jgi:hypothetical protein
MSVASSTRRAGVRDARASEALGGPGWAVVVDALLIGLIMLAAVLRVADAPAAVRVPIVFLAASLAPGGAVLRLLPDGSRTSSLAVAVSLSLSIEIAGSLVMVWTGWWHPLLFAVVIGGLSAAVLMVDLSRRGRPLR